MIRNVGDHSAVDQGVLTVLRVPRLIARLMTTAIRLLLLLTELAISIISIPLLIPLLALRLLGRTCDFLDKLLGMERTRYASPASASAREDEGDRAPGLRRATASRMAVNASRRAS